MKRRNLPKKDSREKIRREKDPIPWRYCLLTLVCGVFLVGGFFVAARSHFASIDFGIKNSSLKKQLEGLEAEKRRLQWLRETALAPAEIKKAAKKLGLTETTAANFVTFSSKTEGRTEKTAAVKKAGEKTAPLVEKTVYSKPVDKTGREAAPKTVVAIGKPKNPAADAGK